MNCEEIAPYLPGLSSDELGDETIGWVQAHVDGCASCRADASRYRAVAAGLVALREREITPPAFLVDSIVERVRSESRRRYFPVSPLIPAELVRVVQDNREAVGAVAGVALAAGAAYAVWRTIRRARPSPAV